jgi:L-alanine-DL-glutamate epimerase-like enolase superfamily enzyme
VPIAAGENEFTTAAFAALIGADAVDVLQPNITRAGGVSSMLAIGKLCADAGVKLAPHGVGGSVGVAAALHACRAASGFHIFEANRLLNPMRDELGLHPPRLEDGALVAQDLPGHGGEPCPERLTRYRLDAEGSTCAHPGA